MREKLRGGYGSLNTDGVIDLLQRFGVWGLSGCDGCECANLAVLAISIDVSCHKSGHVVRVYSRSLGCDAGKLIPVAREVLSQLSSPRGYTVRFCDYAHDHKNGGQSCCWCGKTRDDADAYLCDECLQQNQGTGHYPLNLTDLTKALMLECAEQTTTR